jgi:hypothetical protein
MKFIKVLLFLYLCLTQNVSGYLRKNKFKNKKSILKHGPPKAADTTIMVYNNKFYSICVYVDSKINADCKGVGWYKISYNCDPSESAPADQVSNGTIPKPVYIDPNFPHDMKIAILKTSKCLVSGGLFKKNVDSTNVIKSAELNQPSSFKILSTGGSSTGPKSYRENDNDTRKAKVRLINGWIKSNWSKGLFYNIGDYVLSFNPKYASYQNIKWLSEQFNTSIKLLQESLKEEATPRDPTFGSPEEIFLNPQSHPDTSLNIEENAEKDKEFQDLKIEKAGLYIENILEGIYHQVLYVCAVGKDRTGGNRAFHFIIDRAARDFTHENLNFRKIIWTTFSGQLLSTLVRVTYYNASPNCSDPTQRPDDPKFNPNYEIALIHPQTSNKDPGLLAHFKNNSRERSKFEPLDPQGEKYKLTDVTEQSFNDFVMGIQRYAWMYNMYDPMHNCQQFATGMFNYLTSSQNDPINIALMRTLFNFDKDIHMKFKEWSFFDRSKSDEWFRGQNFRELEQRSHK